MIMYTCSVPLKAEYANVEDGVKYLCEVEVLNQTSTDRHWDTCDHHIGEHSDLLNSQ